MTASPDFRRRLQARVNTDRQPLRAEVTATPDSGGDVAVFRLYDPIDSWGGPWGISAKEFADALDEVPETAAEIRVHINSPGGEVTEAVAILNNLRHHPAPVVAIVDGVAASAAAVIAAGVDRLIMARNSELMIHDAWGLCVGNAADMKQLADLLDHMSDNIAAVYQSKAGGTVAEWRVAMGAETWYSADEAVAAGLADSVDGAEADPAAKARFDLTIFNFAGRSDAPGPQASAIPPSPSPVQGQEGAPMSDLTAFRNALGLADDVTDDAIIEALGTLPEPTEETAPSATPVVPSGHIAVPEARIRDLEVAAQRGVEAAETLRTQERARFLDSVRAKYAPANRAAWEKEYDRDPEGTRKHFDTAPDILPIAQLGHGGEADLDDDKDFNDFAALYGVDEARRAFGRKETTHG